jgi:uncharacterized coiled-coil DUF342 family protein
VKLQSPEQKLRQLNEELNAVQNRKSQLKNELQSLQQDIDKYIKHKVKAETKYTATKEAITENIEQLKKTINDFNNLVVEMMGKCDQYIQERNKTYHFFDNHWSKSNKDKIERENLIGSMKTIMDDKDFSVTERINQLQDLINSNKNKFKQRMFGDKSKSMQALFAELGRQLNDFKTAHEEGMTAENKIIGLR